MTLETLKNSPENTEYASPSLPLSRQRRESAAALLSTFLLIVATLTYFLSYESIPRVSPIAGMLVVALAISCTILTSLLNPRSKPLVTGLLVLCGITAALHLFGPIQNFEALTRYLASFSGLFSLVFLPMRDLRRIVAYLAAALTAYAVLRAVIGGWEVYAGTLRLMPFWAGLHSSSFVMAALVVVFWVSPWRKKTRLIWAGIASLMVIGYGVVTAILMLLVFGLGRWLSTRQRSRGWLYLGGGFAAAVGMLFRDSTSVVSISEAGLASAGSGRIGAWLERLSVFIERDVVLKLFGSGPMTDYRTTTQWWWEEKSAHSDFITMIMEFGVVGFVALSIMLVLLYQRTPRQAQPVLLAVFIAMASSNAFLERPLVGVMWGFALYCTVRHDTQPQIKRSEAASPAPERTAS